MKLEIITREEPCGHVVALVGSIHAANGDEVLQALLPLALPSRRLVLDASRLEFVSSAGLRLLLQLHRAVKASDGQLILAGLLPDVAEVMHVTGFLPHFSHVQSVNDALVPE